MAKRTIAAMVAELEAILIVLAHFLAFFVRAHWNLGVVALVIPLIESVGEDISDQLVVQIGENQWRLGILLLVNNGEGPVSNQTTKLLLLTLVVFLDSSKLASWFISLGCA